MRALILGSGGRVGTLLRAAWKHPQVIPIWHQRKGGFDILADTPALQAAMSDVDVILNLAGTTHHGPDVVGSANTEIAKNVLDHAAGKPVFLFSSAAIYGCPASVLTEDTVPAPISDYGRDKVAMESVAQHHAAHSVILRIGNVAGADALLGVKRANYVLDQFSSGQTPRRSYIGPSLLARTLAELCLQAATLPPVINIATPRAVSMAALLDAMQKPWTPRPAPREAVEEVELSTGLLEKHVDLPADASHPAMIVRDFMSVRNIS